MSRRRKSSILPESVDTMIGFILFLLVIFSFIVLTINHPFWVVGGVFALWALYKINKRTLR